jgi:spore maturation protein CgeB
MLILYVGQLNSGGTCLMRLQSLQAQGYNVVPFDTTYLSNGSRISNVLRTRLGIGVEISKFNKALITKALETRPSLIWVDKGVFVRPASIAEIKSRIKVCVVHYNPDDPFGAYRSGWRTFLKAIPFYDFHFVTRDVNIPEYRKMGAKVVQRAYWGFEPNIHRPHNLPDSYRIAYGGEVGFIGDWESPRAKTIDFIGNCGIAVRVWGTRWHKCRFKNNNVKLELKPLFNDEYAIAICKFDINLGFLRKGNRDQSTTRSVEIPACGGFMLAERTVEHLALFDEGKEAEFFGCNEELLEKLKFYLRHQDRREEIAAAGRQRCLKSGYSNRNRLEMMFKTLPINGNA